MDQDSGQQPASACLCDGSRSCGSMASSSAPAIPTACPALLSGGPILLTSDILGSPLLIASPHHGPSLGDTVTGCLAAAQLCRPCRQLDVSREPTPPPQPWPMAPWAYTLSHEFTFSGNDPSVAGNLSLCLLPWSSRSVSRSSALRVLGEGE